jgi:hypothetical protein
MPTSPEQLRRPEDEVISLLSHWLARHLDNAQLRHRLDAFDQADLSREQAEVLGEVRAELNDHVSRARLEPVVRETLEALALGL